MTASGRLWAFANYSRFVRPGAVRTVTPYLTSTSSDTAAQATIGVSGGAFTATIPARSLVTYDIPAGSTATGNTVTVTDPGNQPVPPAPR